jgi:hypothetical protein
LPKANLANFEANISEINFILFFDDSVLSLLYFASTLQCTAVGLLKVISPFGHFIARNGPKPPKFICKQQRKVAILLGQKGKTAQIKPIGQSENDVNCQGRAKIK